jgi:prolyl-tRNA synthetase
MLKKIPELLEDIQNELWVRGNEELKRGIRTIEDLKDARAGINRMGWCGEESCGHDVEDITDMSVLGTLYGGEEFEGNCIVCGKPTKIAAYVAKTY